MAAWQFKNGTSGEMAVSVLAIIGGIGLLFTRSMGTRRHLHRAALGNRGSISGRCVGYQPIIEEDLNLVLPNVWKMLVAIVLFIYIGRERIDHRMAS